MKKICILHDTFLYRWGWERLVYLMAKILKSDLASGFFDKWSFDLKQLLPNQKLIAISSPVFKKWLRHLKLKFAFLFQTNFLKQYNTVVFSWDCLSAVRNCNKETKKIYYCHTPPRYLFDQKNEYLKKVNFFLKPIYKILFLIFKWIYFNDLKKIDFIYVNSKNTQNRLKKFTWKDSIIIYPPTDTDFFKPSQIRKNYYLSFARLSSIKRVDKIIEVFKILPDKNLKFTYWINDPEKDKILNTIKWYKNIEAIKSPDDKSLKKLISESIATIYIPVDEDFGMAPVESMACWVPVIWVHDWWLKESIIDWKTWFLINKNCNLKYLKNAINKLDLKTSLKMKNDCLKQSKKFSLHVFEDKIIKNI